MIILEISAFGCIHILRAEINIALNIRLKRTLAA